MSNLFNITQELLQLRNNIEAEEEFADDESALALLNESLEIREGELATKTEGYVAIITQAEAQASMAEKEFARIEAFVLKKRKVAERLKAALLQGLLIFGEEDDKGIKRFETGTHTLSTRRSKSIKILDDAGVTDDCKLYDVKFANLTPEIKKFLAKRIEDLPESIGKSALITAFKPELKLSKTLIKKKLEEGDVDWAEVDTKYNITIK